MVPLCEDPMTISELALSITKLPMLVESSVFASHCNISFFAVKNPVASQELCISGSHRISDMHIEGHSNCSSQCDSLFLLQNVA